MKLLLIGHEEHYALEQLQLALFPGEPMELCTEPFSGDGAISALHRGKTWLTAVTIISRNGKVTRSTRRLAVDQETVRLRRRLLQQAYYLAALKHLYTVPVWGALSGVRPTKITTKLLQEGMTREEAGIAMKNIYFVSPERRALCLDASEATLEAKALLRPKDVSMYVGIPFCPTRCAYCSFVSAATSRSAPLLSPYVEALLKEVRETGRCLKEAQHTVRSLYIGGGTPTTLSAKQLDVLLTAIEESFDLSECLEYTVEAGRPDTITPEKMQVLAKHGVGRVSINPQSMDDHVLELCGRHHKVSQIPEAFQMARDAGFKEINMDLIAGLPGDTPEGFRNSLERVAAMHPENITVHTLALKKGADLYEHREGLPSDEDVSRMVEFSNDYLRKLGYRPYYLYRQKYMSGSFENVGWCLPGTEGLYNICMMEELHSVLALGGGAVSKVNLPDGRLERFANPKFPQQYLERLDNVLADKQKLCKLLSELH